MELQIRLLGTVELCVDGETVTPGAAKRRAVLAGLAIEANHSVPLPRLARMVWSDYPPTSATANLRTHAAGLRRTVGDRLVALSAGVRAAAGAARAGRDRVPATGGGGAVTAPSADPAGAIDTLTSALAWWRGPSGEGLPRSTALDNRWAALDEQRLQVFEELTEARLAAGEHAHLLSDLRAHLAAHPLRERAWGHLMLALYRCGDVPAALTVYRDARAVLDEQLGLEPGAELARLHRAMLDRAPELSYVEPEACLTASAPVRDLRPAVGWAVPRELPADPLTYVARTGETADVVAALTAEAPAAVVVTGAPGSGKTTLAVRAGHTVSALFPRQEVFVDLGYRTSVTAGEVLARVLRALGVPAADVPEKTDERAG